MLLDTWSEENRVVDVGLMVTYQRYKVYGRWEWHEGLATIVEGIMYKYTRRATKTYRYVGMSKTAAQQCVNSLNNSYKRNIKLSLWNDDGTWSEVNGGSVLMTDVVSINQSGTPMYTVEVQVNETDEKWDDQDIDPSSKFYAEDQRTYDY